MPAATLHAATSPKPIRFGLSCWLWEWRRHRSIRELADHLGVSLELSQRCRGLRRDIEGVVSGPKTDEFLSEFVRRC